MGHKTAPFAKGQLRANMVMESVWQDASLIDLMSCLIFNRGPSQPGHPSLTRKGFFMQCNKLSLA